VAPESSGTVRRVRSTVPAQHDVRIGEDGGRAALLVDGVVQSISPEDSLHDGGYWAAMVPSDERPHHALILGLGGGTLAGLLQARWGGVSIVGVDDDPTILATASGIGWLPSGGMDVVQGDAFEYVQTCHTRFDYVAVDLFRGERLVSRAFGKPFLRQLRAVLQPRGQLAINLFRDFRWPERVNRIAALFEVRAQVPVGGNVVVHARNRRA
jgi:spermidine synthase